LPVSLGSPATGPRDSLRRTTAEALCGLAPMATLAAPRPLVRHNLPASLTSFIGRERELVEVQARLAGARLVTLTGVGGCGKTRLALEVARTVLDRYPDGVWLVERAALADAALVPQTVAAVFDLRELPGQAVANALATSLRGRNLLLVLDNCEHLLDACARLVDGLLRACPELRVLVTSREALGITGEIAWRVPSLPVPDPQHLPPFTQLGQSPAVRLFVERAAAVQPQFALSERNAAMVAQVCQRLDGIPLALELAAARIEALSVEQLAARLDQRFRLLTGGSRTALPRQQTLHATLDWSYDLLSEPERHLFNRLAVFAGGWTLEAAEAVGAGDGIEPEGVLDLLQHLVRKSLVVAEESGDSAERYRLLETLRQYAHERLVMAGELETVQQRHALAYLALAEEVEPRSGERAWHHRLIAEHANLRTALRWLIDHNDVEHGVRLGGRLGDVWVWGGFVTEGRAQLQRLLALPGASLTSPEWGQLLRVAGFVDTFAGEFATARARLERAVAVRRALADPQLARTISDLGQVAREQADYAAAQAWLEESLLVCEAVGDRRWFARTLDRLGTVAQALGQYGLARSRYEHSLALAREVGDRTEVAWSLHNLGCLALDQHEYATARERLTQSLTSRLDNDSIGFVHGLAEFACLAAAEGRPAAALRLAGATAALTQQTGIIVQPTERGRYEHWLAQARQALGEDAAEAAWAEGQRMRLEQALAYALAPHEAVGVSAAAERSAAPAGTELTQRQREVAALIARGLSNRQIGEALVITERTVAAHVEHILNKLGFSSRTQIALWAAEQGLLASSRT
jgi:predicted ATPase/DNA-binding CsgD family transcriptional regulator